VQDGIYLELFAKPQAGSRSMNTTYCFEKALVGEVWVDNVRLLVSSLGDIESVECGAVFTKRDAIVLGYAIPGIPNVHSHAFQRAMRGLAEYSTSSSDSFWTWREQMYRFAQALTPEDLEVVASQLYLEMLKAGYTSVAEFHYLHHRPGGEYYARPEEMSAAILAAATKVGIGLTHLPVLYMTPDFDGGALAQQQRRFCHDLESFQLLLERLKPQLSNSPQTRLGCALHSLRAVPDQPRHDLLAFLARFNSAGVIHIHIAEQRKEVEDCLRACGQRPVEWLMNQHDVNEQWCLVHATHLNAAEISSVANSGAVVGLCPTTEANLGDGFFPLKPFLERGGTIALGSDSHVSVSPIEEMRWLEYGQRLVSQTRNVVSSAHQPHSGSSVLAEVLAGGGRAMGVPTGRIAPGYRADIAVLDSRDADLAQQDDTTILDRAIFSGNGNRFRHVMAGGEWVVNNYTHARQDDITERYVALMKKLG
jgi:formimidoylglutamate deiminase